MKEIVIFKLEKLDDGTLFVGNSEIVDAKKAIELIEKGEAKADGHPIGVVPAELKSGGKKNAGVEVTSDAGNNQ